MSSVEIIKTQNKIIVKILWIISSLAFINNIATVQDIKAGALIVVCCGGLSFLMSYMVYKNKMIGNAKYLALAGTFVTSFIFIQFTPGFLSYMTIYIAIIILSIYHDKRIIFISGIIGIALSTYSYYAFKDMIFNPRYDSFLAMVSINFFIIMVCSLLYLQIKFSYKIKHSDD